MSSDSRCNRNGGTLRNTREGKYAHAALCGTFSYLDVKLEYDSHVKDGSSQSSLFFMETLSHMQKCISQANSEYSCQCNDYSI